MTDSVDSSPPPPPPERLGRYRIERRLGAGGMAEVFLARSTGAEGVDKLLVVKRILPSFAKSERFTAMFVDEAKVAMRLNHPNVVQVYAFEQSKDGFLLAMELVDGLDLGGLLAAARRRGRRLPHGLAAYVVHEVAKGLDYAHNRRDEHGEPLEIVHRDVSPQNVLLTHDGVVKVADFGIAKARLVTEDTGIIKGKFAYMSPEQARAEEVDRRSDVYALGVLFAELLMGRSMYPGQQGLEVLEQVRAAKVTRPSEVDPSVPEALDAIVAKATALDREARFPTARAMAAALAQYLRADDVVYDAEALERFLADVAPREPRGAAPVEPAPEDAAESAPEDEPAERRERRRVILLVGRVHGEGGVGRSVGPRAAKVLSDLAYKNDAVLGWYHAGGELRFRYTLGLGKASVQDPLKALRLSTDVLEALVAVAEDAEEWVEVTLGIARGMVSAVRDQRGRLVRQTYLGGVLEVAEALADAGEAGEVIASGEIYRLVRRDFAFEELGGGPTVADRALRTWRLVGVRSREERAEDVRPSGAQGGLVGRGPALATLEEIYRQAVATRRTMFAGVVGELGVGKTALLSALLGGLRPAPLVLRTDCLFGYADVPYRVLGELVRDVAELSAELEGQEAMLRLAEFLGSLIDTPDHRTQAMAGLAPLLGAAPSGPHDPEDDDRPMRVAHALELVLGALARRGPVVVWVDGLQWADGASLGVIRLLLERTYHVPCLFLLSMRPDPRTVSLLAGVPRVDLDELPEPDARRLVTQRLGGAEVPDAIMRPVLDRAGGNPLFVLELVEALLERGVIELVGQPGGGFRVERDPELPIAFPSTLEEVIAGRLDELPEPQWEAVRWLAVARAGLREADLASLASAAAVDAVKALVERGLVARRPGGTLAFASAVVRHVAYESLEPDEKVRMHRRIARHLAALPSAPKARVAFHLELAGQAEDAGAAWLEAGEAAFHVASHEEALHSFERALALLPDDPPRRFRAHAGRERVLRSLGRRTEQLAELAVMRSIAEAARLDAARAVALTRLARFELDGRRTAGVRALLEQALAAARAAGDEGAEIDTLRLSAELARDEGRLGDGLEACERALLRCAERPAFQVQRGLLLVLRGTLLRKAGRLREAHEAIAQAVVLFARSGMRRYEAYALDALAEALTPDGALADAVRLLRASLVLDRDAGHRLNLGRKLAGLGQLYATLGDSEASRRFFARALQVVDALGDREGHADVLLLLAEVSLDEGDLFAVASLVGSARGLSRPGDPPELRARADLLAARLAAAEGDHGRVLYLARAIAPERLPSDAHRFERALLEATASLERGDTVVARHVAGTLVPALPHLGAHLRGDRLLAQAEGLFRRLDEPVAAGAAHRLGLDVIERRATRLEDDTQRERYVGLGHVRRLLGPSARVAAATEER